MKIIKIKYIAIFWVIFLLGCTVDKDIEGDFVTTEVFPYIITLEINKDQYGMWLEIIDRAELSASLNIFGRYTFFAPNNEAVQKWLGSRSIIDLTKDEAETLVRNHMFNVYVESVNFNEGCVANDTNLIGDYISVSFAEDGINTIELNHQATIVDRDVELVNGIMHGIDKVLEPHTTTMLDYVESNPQLSILKEALTKTNMLARLNDVSFVNKYGINRRKYYTLLAISDSTFNRLGIKSYEDLVDKYSDSGDVTNLDNGLNRWVRYRVLYDAYFTNSMLDYDVMADAVNLESYLLGEGIQVSERRGRIRLNYTSYVDDDVVVEEYTSILKDSRNIPQKNGVIHFVNTLLDIVPLRPTWIDWDPTVVENTAAIPNYSPPGWTLPNWIYDEVELGVLDEWNWETWPEMVKAKYIICNGWFPRNAAVLFDIENNDGGWFEVETPLIPAGRYAIRCYDRRWPEGGTFDILIDGEIIGRVNQHYAGGDIIGAPYWTQGHVFEDTRRHTLRIQYREGRSSFIFGRVTFEPR